MDLTITAKFKILPTDEQKIQLTNTIRAIREGLNFVSQVCYDTNQLSQSVLHQLTYGTLRATYGLRSQMAQSVMKTVIAKYKSMRSNGVFNTFAHFQKPEYDLVFNRDYSLKNKIFSLNTLDGRIKVSFHAEGMEQYFDGTWSLGTAKLVMKKNKFFLHVPMTKEIETLSDFDVKNVVGVDLGINFLAVSYDSKEMTTFYHGRHVKNKRAHYKRFRKHLQRRGTRSARRRIKTIGDRENRWMTDINHQISKALVTQAGENSLIVLEDLSTVRQVTEKVRIKDRYVSVSWAFGQLRDMITYKAQMNHSAVKVVDPKYTSQTCPKCGHTEKSNRNKKMHCFKCKNCTYQTNDDRIGAMNLRRKGIEYLAEVTANV